jgi:hypothetical protein
MAALKVCSWPHLDEGSDDRHAFKCDDIEAVAPQS